MILKHLLEDLARVGKTAHEYAETNIHGVELNETGVFFEYDTTDLDYQKEETARLEDEIKKASVEFDELEKEKEEVETQLNQLTEWANQIKANGVGAAFGELLECNKAQEKSLIQYKEALSNYKTEYDKQCKTIEKLRARKNTAKVTERCVKTGKLIAEFQGKRFYLEEIK